MKPIRLFPSLLVTALSLAVAGCGPAKDDAPPTPKAAAAVNLPKLGAAPAWKLTDVNGKVVSSEDLKGKVVVVDFWATWCGPCRIEIPGYVELQKKYGSDGLVIVGASIDEAGPAVVKDFGTKSGINYPLVMATEEVQSAFGGLQVVPTTFLIDRDGQIRDRKEGVEDHETYEAKVRSVM